MLYLGEHVFFMFHKPIPFRYKEKWNGSKHYQNIVKKSVNYMYNRGCLYALLDENQKLSASIGVATLIMKHLPFQSFGSLLEKETSVKLTRLQPYNHRNSS